MKESFLKRIDNWHLELLGIIVVSIILLPIIFLYVRDGNGSAIFPVHDQLDETILNYVFPAKYFGASVYEQMMCGIPAEGLKPFCLIFVPLFAIFDVYTAVVIQYVIVVITAFYGMYFCIKKITDSSVSSAITATIFAFLPVHSVYGNVVMGTPLLLFSVLKLREEKKKNKIIGVLGLIYYGLSTSMVLSGWAGLALILIAYFIFSWMNKKSEKWILVSFGILAIIYVLCNMDLFREVFASDSYVSHRVEFGLASDGQPFLKSFIGVLTNDSYVYEAETKHKFIFIPIAIAFILLLFIKRIRQYLQIYMYALACVLGLATVYAVLETKFICDIMKNLPGMLSSFNVSRVTYFLPGMMYILLGISCAAIIRSVKDKYYIFTYILVAILVIPSFFHIVKDEDGIFYQNINQINNGQGITGYITMRNLYSEELMTTIENAIGKDMSTYRIVNIGISPVASLMHGFYTIDGYSNNYSLEYKHTFREVVAEELELNDYNKAYFDLWGNRCYAFYHEWGNAYLLGNGFSGKITDLHLNFEKMKEMNCQYIFSAGEIMECEQYGLSFIGEFTNEESFWDIWVYEVFD